ncbi:hypothetical protein ABPG72_008138 [Tetrahymena utriculariae]
MMRRIQRNLYKQSIMYKFKQWFSNSQNLISFESDSWNSIHVNIKQIPQEKQLFSQILKDLEKQWLSDQKRAVWLKINVNQLEVLQDSINLGYKIHHATSEHIILSKWLLEGQKNTLPGYASHYVGCGGAVINSKNEVLMVQEKYGYNSEIWSFPGGRADPSEEINETAEREIYEELGMKVEAVDLLLLRESTQSIFNKPDLYFAFLMRPVEQNPEIKIDKEELNNYTWVPLSKIDEFIEKQHVSDFYVQRAILDKVNSLHKQGFDFQNDRLSIKNSYKNYPRNGANYTMYQLKNPKN